MRGILSLFERYIVMLKRRKEKEEEGDERIVNIFFNA